MVLESAGTCHADRIQVSRIKERVEEKEGIPPAQQRLIYGGKQMYVSLPPVLQRIPRRFSHTSNPLASKIPC
jgi:hypothetical protein